MIITLTLRVTGIAAYFLIAGSMLCGELKHYLAQLPVRMRSAVSHGHESLALVGIVVMVAHVAAIVPWVLQGGMPNLLPAMMGMIATGLYLAIAYTSGVRRRLSPAHWRHVHAYADAAYVALVIHGWLAGPDTWMQACYVGLSLIIGALLMLRLQPHWFTHWKGTFMRGMVSLALVAAIVVAAVPNLMVAHAAPASVTCTLRLPDHALTAQGLATPFVLEKGCHENNTGESAFVQAAIINPTTGAISIYAPMVEDQGTTPVVNPIFPTFNLSDTVALWFGFNGDTLKLANTGGDHCQQFRAQFAYCNAPTWFAAANTAIAAGLITVPPLGTANDGLPCPTTRDASVVDQDQSDNLPLAGNGSDNGLLANYLDPALGCAPWRAPDLSRDGLLVPSLALNELQAAADQAEPVMLVPLGDPMVHHSSNLVESYRAGVDQPQEASNNTQHYCEAMHDAGLPRLLQDQSYTSIAASPAPSQASSLYAFLGMRFSQSWGLLHCHGDNPVKLTTVNGIVTNWQLASHDNQEERAER